MKLLLCGGAIAILAMTAFVVAQQPGKKKADIVIVITMDGVNSKYVEKSKYDKGEKKQEPVIVMVGQTVEWINTDDDVHTATKKGVFDTGDIDAGATSKAIAFDKNLFKAAGGKEGGTVDVKYVCLYHPNMKATIKLVDKKKE
jgi:plastocyanin